MPKLVSPTSQRFAEALAGSRPTIAHNRHSQTPAKDWVCVTCACPEALTPVKRPGPDGQRVTLILIATS